MYGQVSTIMESDMQDGGSQIRGYKDRSGHVLLPLHSQYSSVLDQKMSKAFYGWLKHRDSQGLVYVLGVRVKGTQPPAPSPYPSVHMYPHVHGQVQSLYPTET